MPTFSTPQTIPKNAFNHIEMVKSNNQCYLLSSAGQLVFIKYSLYNNRPILGMLFTGCYCLGLEVGASNAFVYVFVSHSIYQSR